MRESTKDNESQQGNEAGVLDHRGDSNAENVNPSHVRVRGGETAQMAMVIMFESDANRFPARRVSAG